MTLINSPETLLMGRLILGNHLLNSVLTFQIVKSVHLINKLFAYYVKRIIIYVIINAVNTNTLNS
jgi:hypothetical protein